MYVYICLTLRGAEYEWSCEMSPCAAMSNEEPRDALGQRFKRQQLHALRALVYCNIRLSITYK